MVPLNVDLSTLSAATDVALGHGDPPDLVVDLNFQASRDADTVPRVMLYHAALHLRYRVPVHSIVVLLRPAADDPAMSGKLHYRPRPGKGKMEFSYEVVRLWRMPVERILAGGLGTLALAPLCRMPRDARLEDALPKVLEVLIERLDRQTSQANAGKILTGAYVLTGLRLSRQEARQLFGRVRAVQESTTYQAILEEGAVKELHNTLLRLGEERFGAAPVTLRNNLMSIEDLDRLRRFVDQMHRVKSWQKLLAVP
jgi:predicted transposase YdaD